jgi:hypothetical protein
MMSWLLAFRNRAFPTSFHVHFLTRLLHSDGVGGEQTTTTCSHLVFTVRLGF